MSVRSTQAPVRARLERARENARREILLSAAAVFARRGYAAATLADLAQAAGYAAPSLYRYFESKEEIFRSLLELIHTELVATFEAPVDRTRPLAERLTALLVSQLELATRHRDVFTVLLRQQPDGSPGRPPIPDQADGQVFYVNYAKAWLERHVARRELRCPLDAAALALASLTKTFHLAFGGRGKPATTEQVRLLVDLVLHGISATPANGH